MTQMARAGKNGYCSDQTNSAGAVNYPYSPVSCPCPWHAEMRGYINFVNDYKVVMQYGFLLFQGEEEWLTIRMSGQLSMQSGVLSIPISSGPVMVIIVLSNADITLKRAIVASIEVSDGFQNGPMNDHQPKNPLMKKPVLLSIMISCMAIASAAHAQTTDGSVLYTPNVDLTTLSQNTFTGTVGGVFLTTYNYYPQVNYLGYADPTGVALVDSHVVTLWDNNPSGGGSPAVLASATIPAGTPALLMDGYDWVQLPSTVQLTYGHYYVIGASVVGGVDTWGDLINNNSPDNGNNGQINWNSQYVQLGSGWEFSRGGRYDSASDYPNEPPNQTSAQDSIYPAANLGFDLEPVPEPGTLGIAGIGVALFFGSASLRKTFSKSINRSDLEN